MLDLNEYGISPDRPTGWQEKVKEIITQGGYKSNSGLVPAENIFQLVNDIEAGKIGIEQLPLAEDGYDHLKHLYEYQVRVDHKTTIDKNLALLASLVTTSQNNTQWYTNLVEPGSFYWSGFGNKNIPCSKAYLWFDKKGNLVTFGREDGLDTFFKEKVKSEELERATVFIGGSGKELEGQMLSVVWPTDSLYIHRSIAKNTFELFNTSWWEQFGNENRAYFGTEPDVVSKTPLYPKNKPLPPNPDKMLTEMDTSTDPTTSIRH